MSPTYLVKLDKHSNCKNELDTPKNIDTTVLQVIGQMIH